MKFLMLFVIPLFCTCEKENVYSSLYNTMPGDCGFQENRFAKADSTEWVYSKTI